jgi:6-phosphofructokinase 1
VPFVEEKFLARWKEIVQAEGYCVIVVGEGLKNEAGQELGADKTRVDAFGHPVLSGAAEALADIVESKLGTKTRTVKLGYAQRAAAHFASATDASNAHACGSAAVKAAVEGQSGFMVKIVRGGSNGHIQWSTGLQPLGDIANVEHFIPRDWITEDGFLPNDRFIEYARPLIEGELKFPMDGGLPRYVVLDKERVEKKLPPRA